MKEVCFVGSCRGRSVLFSVEVLAKGRLVHSKVTIKLSLSLCHTYHGLQLCLRNQLINLWLNEKQVREIPHLLASLRNGPQSASGWSSISLKDDLKVLCCFWLVRLGHTIRAWKQWKTCRNIEHNDLYHEVLMVFYEAEIIIIIFIIIMNKCQNPNWA